MALRRGRCVAQGRGGGTWPSRLLHPSLLPLHLGLLCHLEASVWGSLDAHQAAGAFPGHRHCAARAPPCPGPRSGPVGNGYLESGQVCGWGRVWGPGLPGAGHPPTWVRQGRNGDRPRPQGSGQSGRSQQDGSSGPRLRLEAQRTLQPGEVGGRLRAGEPALLLEDGRQGLRHIRRHVLGIAGQNDKEGSVRPGPTEGRLPSRQRSRLTLPGRSRRPGGPAAPTPAARAPGAGAARTPSAPGGWGRVSLRPAPCPRLGLPRTPT